MSSLGMTTHESGLRLNVERRACPAAGKRLSVCALVPYPPGIAPSQRYRIEQWQPILANEGIDVELWPFLEESELELLYSAGRWRGKASVIAGATARRLATLAGLKRFDVVLVHRGACLAGPAFIERLIARRQPMVFDFDDAIYLLDTTEQNRVFGWLKFPWKTASLCRISRHVVAANDHLARYARRFTRNVTVVPSSIDIERYQPRRSTRPATARLVVGWTGSATSQAHLEAFAPVLGRIIERHGVAVHVVSSQRPDLGGVPFVWRRWSAEKEVQDLAEFDIGIMPLPDDEWTRGKSAFKALQCMGMGLPVVCSAVGPSLDLIRHGENGLLAKTADEWEESVARLVADGSLRERLGAAGRRTIEERFSMTRSARALAEVLRAAAEAQARTSE